MDSVNARQEILHKVTVESFKKGDTVKDEVSINSSVPIPNGLLNLKYRLSTKQEPAAVVKAY